MNWYHIHQFFMRSLSGGSSVVRLSVCPSVRLTVCPFTVSLSMSAPEGSEATETTSMLEGSQGDFLPPGDSLPPGASQPIETGPTSQPVPQLATTFDEHVWHVVQDVLNRNRETVNPSHMLWLQRQTSRNLVRTLELDRREAELNRREANLRRKSHVDNKRSLIPSEIPECRSSA